MQHAGLTAEVWQRYDRDQQILSIGAEMNRARKRLLAGDTPGLKLAYERILTLAELTVEVRPDPALRRELLIWRDLVAAQYAAPERHLRDHDAAFRALLMLIPAGYAQIRPLLG